MLYQIVEVVVLAKLSFSITFENKDINLTTLRENLKKDCYIHKCKTVIHSLLF